MTGVVDDIPDEELVRAAVRGDEAAFAHLVRRYLRKAMAVAQEYAGSREDAEDVVQDAFRRVYQGLARFDAEREFRPWFFTILRNTAISAARRRRRGAHEELTAEMAAAGPGPEERLQRRELRRRLEAAVQSLPARQQACFRLCAVEGLSSAEAASALGVAESTVRVHTFKARQTLQQLLGEWRAVLEEE
jgi:RNA polymerase sigma-70 factor (ECF subfamily)